VDPVQTHQNVSHEEELNLCYIPHVVSVGPNMTHVSSAPEI
jgi:hypothetical protein